MQRDITSKTLEAARINAGYRQSDLATIANVSRSKIAMVETGERYLNTDELIRCAEALNVSPAYLLTGYADENRTESPSALGLSEKTINRIRSLNKTDKHTLSMFEALINDDGSPLRKSGDPDLSFAGILSHIMSDSNSIRIVDPDSETQAPHKLMLRLGDGTLISPNDLRPLEMYQNKLIKRLAVIRRKYLNNLPAIRPPEEEEDDEES